MLFMTIELLAGATPPGTQSSAPFWVNLFPIILMFVVFYFLLIRPQTKRQRELENMQKNLKSGMKVLTASGIVGTVLTVRERTLTLRSGDAKLEITRGAVTEVLEKGESTAEEEPAPPKK